ncbi:hypothetical protein ACFU7Y_32185 [Kitasatospora sp. NPDC057542]
MNEETINDVANLAVVWSASCRELTAHQLNDWNAQSIHAEPNKRFADDR